MTAAARPMTPGVPRAARVRAYLAGAVITLGLVGVAMKAWALQIDDGDRYRAIAARQHALRVDIPAPRGEVLDARGRPLAISAGADSVWADPRDVKDVTATAERLAALVGGDPGALEAKLAGNKRFAWIARHVRPEIARAVRAAKLPGIDVASEPRRWYPARTIGGTVIGRADIDGNGLDGIELSMNELLSGRRGAVTAVRDARGRRMLADGLASPEAGATVQLTLDRSVQAIAEEALGAAIETNKAKHGVAVVLDVATSKVLALASYPTYDPNGGDSSGARNRPVTDVYEAGSVLKVFTVAAALDAGLVKADTGFTIGSYYKVGPKLVRDTHVAAYLTTKEIIQHSSNIGAVKIAQRVGREKLHAYFQRLGFGTRTGIELPGEQPGLMRDGARWREIELATISFGYGLTVTPLQIAAALAALGNDGVYREPRIVERVTGDAGEVLYRGDGEARRILSPAHAADMRDMLASVFEKGGTAQSVVVPGFRCGGKTGTAHKYDPAIKAYSPNRYLASFIGLAPIDDPRLAIVVLIDEPSGGAYYGGKVAAPAFAKIASETLRYLGVPGEALPPEKVKPSSKSGSRSASGSGSASASASGSDSGSGSASGSLTVPVADSEAELEAEPDPGIVIIPDLRGMGVSRALDEARKLRVAVELAGTGKVAAQEPPPGTAVRPVRLRLTFAQ
jgi:cell division protein FtsI (penicillin-binding protein 3)